MSNDENNEIHQLLRANFSDVASSIDANVVADRLFEEEIIDIGLLEDIKNRGDRRQRAERLLNILFETAHPKAFIAFRDALRDEGGYNWILEKLGDPPSKSEKKISDTEEERDDTTDVISRMDIFPPREPKIYKFFESEEFATTTQLDSTDVVPFSDHKYSGYMLTGMKIYLRRFDGKTVIGGIEPTYSGDDDGDSKVSVLHGSNNYGYETYEFKLKRGEKIVSAIVGSGYVVDSLTFETSSGRAFDQIGAGGGNKTTVNPPKGGFLSYLEGNVEQVQGCSCVRHLKLVWKY